MRNFQGPGRSAVRSTQGMAATSHPLSTLAAIDILRAGGNAVDAAICASAVQTVVEPQSTGIGGDCFVLYCPAGTDVPIALNGSGRSPAKATIDWYRDRGMAAMPIYGPHSVTVPGAIDAWCRLQQDYGKLGLAEVLAPAIYYAENGYVVHDRVSFDWAASVSLLAADPHSAEIFLPGGQAPLAGDTHRQPALARTLQKIASEGRDGFYVGSVAEAIVRRLKELGGLHTLEDFSAAAGDYVTPISADYGGFRVHQVPPNNQGVTALLMLNILSGYCLTNLEPHGADRLHLEIEAGRLAFRDRDFRLGDAESSWEGSTRMLSSRRANCLREGINIGRAMTNLPDPELATSDTVCIAVVDKDRNAISLINSLSGLFGSGISCLETGVVLHNRAASFRLDSSHPNALAPRKRPLHTLMPGMITRAGRAVMPYGVMGGDYQPFGHAHFLSNVIAYGMDLQEAIDDARVFHRDGCVVVEHGVSLDAIHQLRDKGHTVVIADKPLGGAQAIWIDHERDTLTGASDPRKDGIAAGY